ncbi:MAG: APC family permease [Bdellovibrionales bacterium]|nr:APC family permease [Bdellovibrionales bacterium]
MNVISRDENFSASLSLWDAISVIVGIIVGVGIYEVSPLIIGELQSTRAILLAWIFGGLVSLAGALCYAELASTYPVQGGDYYYLSRAYGPRIGFLFGWAALIIVRPGSLAAMAFPFAHYLQTIYSPLSNSRWAAQEDLIFASIAILLLTGINCLPTKSNKWALNILTALKVLGLCAIAFLILFQPAASNPSPIAPSHSSFYLPLILILFTFGGWNEIAYVASEIRESKKNIVKASIVGLGLVLCVYLLITFAFLKSLGIENASKSSAIAYDAIAQVFPDTGAKLISLLIMISTLSALNGMIFTGARISYAMGKAQPRFHALSKLSSSTKIPWVALLAQGALALLVIWCSGSFSISVVYTTAVVWLFFLATGVSLFVLRKKDSHIERPYAVSLYPYTPIVFCVTALLLIYSALQYDLYGSLLSFFILGLGMVFYQNQAEV